MLNKIFQISRGLTKKYPQGNTAFQIITRLVEECGELAKEVNHFENSGIKRKKYGLPKKQKMAKEVQDVLRSALQIVQYYDIEKELEKSIKDAYKKLYGHDSKKTWQ